MADEAQNGDTSSSQEAGQCSGSTVEINIKTLDSRIYKFSVKKDVPVPVLKEKVANAAGVPVEQQRLIFRGKVLKDDHLLSTYNLEDGDTLHLVVRQPTQSQSSSGTGSGDSSQHNPNQGTDLPNSVPRNMTGQVSHSVVVGTVNIADPGDGMMADISRVVGAALQSLGAGGVLAPGAAPNSTAFSAARVAPNNETGGPQTAGGANSSGNQAQLAATSSNQPFQIPQFVQFGGPLQNMVIPDSLTTISDFINRMELILQNTGSQSPAPSHSQGPPSSESSVNMTSLPTPEMLGSVVNHVNQLLSGNVATAFARIAERLQGQRTYSDPVIRSQIQAETLHIATVMQHLGAMLLELGRTTQMIRMGQSPAESFVSAGSAVYISPTGPNPIMVQPFPQMGSFITSSIPGILSGSVGAGDLLRNINIHVSGPNTGDGSLGEAPNTEQVNQGGRVAGDPASIRGMPGRTVVAAIPARAPGQPAGHVLSVVYPVQVRTQQLVATLPTPSRGAVSTRTNGQNSSHNLSTEGSVASQSTTSGRSHFVVPTPLSQTPPAVNPVNEQAANAFSANVHGETSESPNVKSSLPASGSLSSKCGEDQSNGVKGSSSSVSDRSGKQESEHNLPTTDVTSSHHGSNTSASNKVKEPPSSTDPGTSDGKTLKASLGSSPSHNGESGTAIPLGLGLGGLQSKRRTKTTKPDGKEGSSQVSTEPNQSQESIAKGQQVLQSLISQRSGTNRSNGSSAPAPMPPILSQIAEQGGARGPMDAGAMMSQVLQTPAFNNIFNSIAQQTGIGSPSDLRSMMEECTRSPEIRNSLNDFVQQVEGQGEDLGSMPFGSRSGQGGIDLSRMMQQMMPIVSQAFGRAPTRSAPVNSVESEPRSRSNGSAVQSNRSPGRSLEVNLREARESVESRGSPENIFNAVLDSAVNLYGDPDSYQDLINALGDDTVLANEYMDVLQHDIRQRLEKEE